MIDRKNGVFSITIAAIVMLVGSTIPSNIGVAQALLVPEEEHWKYHLKWIWDGDLHKNVGLITPQIVIQNETADRLEGYIADANGTRLAMYDSSQIVMARFMYDTGFVSRWDIVDRVNEGYFAIDIPEKYKDAETVRIHIGNFQYTVDSEPQARVHINSAMTNYATNPALDETTQVAQVEEPQPLPRIFDWGSLIDRILFRYGMLFVGSSNPSK